MGRPAWQRVRWLLLPQLAPIIVLNLVLITIASFNTFDLIIPLSGGGPQNSSHTIVTFLYQFGILRMKIGFGGAVSVLLFIACVIVAIAYRRILFRAEKA